MAIYFFAVRRDGGLDRREHDFAGRVADAGDAHCPDRLGQRVHGLGGADLGGLAFHSFLGVLGMWSDCAAAGTGDHLI